MSSSTGSRFSGLTPLLAPRSVAVLGASSDPTRISGRPIAYMRAQGFQGALYPINPNRAEVQGLKAYPSIADLPETPDVAIVAVAAEVAAPAVEDLGKRGVKAIVMFTAGFAEMDEAGEVAQTKMVATARSVRHAAARPQLSGRVRRAARLLRDVLVIVRQRLAGPRPHRHRQPVRRLRHASLHAGAQPRHRCVVVRDDRQRGRRHGRRMHRLAGGKPRGRRDRRLRRRHS